MNSVYLPGGLRSGVFNYDAPIQLDRKQTFLKVPSLTSKSTQLSIPAKALYGENMLTTVLRFATTISGDALIFTEGYSDPNTDGLWNENNTLPIGSPLKSILCPIISDFAVDGQMGDITGAYRVGGIHVKAIGAQLSNLLLFNIPGTAITIDSVDKTSHGWTSLYDRACTALNNIYVNSSRNGVIINDNGATVSNLRIFDVVQTGLIIGAHDITGSVYGNSQDATNTTYVSVSGAKTGCQLEIHVRGSSGTALDLSTSGLDSVNGLGNEFKIFCDSTITPVVYPGGGSTYNLAPGTTIWLNGSKLGIPANGYDAELDLGIIPDTDNPTITARNTTRLNSALAAMKTDGQFQFQNGIVGPILGPIYFSAKAFYFTGTIVTNTRIGGKIIGGGGPSYWMLRAEYWPGATYGGSVTRFYRLDGQTGGPIIRLRGSGFHIENIEFNGRPWITNNGQESGFGGYSRTRTGIEIEGRSSIPTGLHIIRNCMVNECDYAICTRAGYYNELDNGADPFTASNPGFVSDESHADQTIIDGFTCFGCNSFFRSENQQSVRWGFRDIRIFGFQYTPAGSNKVIIFDIVRGGDFAAKNISINCFLTTVVQVRDFSPNTARMSIEDVKQDGGMISSSYLTLFEIDDSTNQWTAYVGSTSLNWVTWCIRVTGMIANTYTDYDYTKLIVIPAGLVAKGIWRNDLLFDVYRLPLNNFTTLGSGPWVHPN